jgi:hypothetical protein
MQLQRWCPSLAAWLDLGHIVPSPFAHAPRLTGGYGCAVTVRHWSLEGAFFSDAHLCRASITQRRAHMWELWSG